MEVLFSVLGCLGSFALGALVCGRFPQGKKSGAEPEQEPELPEDLRRQWDAFMAYDGRESGR